MAKGSLTHAIVKCLWFSVKINVCQSSLSAQLSYSDLSIGYFLFVDLSVFPLFMVYVNKCICNLQIISPISFYYKTYLVFKTIY